MCLPLCAHVCALSEEKRGHDLHCSVWVCVRTLEINKFMYSDTYKMTKSHIVEMYWWQTKTKILHILLCVFFLCDVTAFYISVSQLACFECNIRLNAYLPGQIKCVTNTGRAWCGMMGCCHLSLQGIWVSKDGRVHLYHTVSRWTNSIITFFFKKNNNTRPETQELFSWKMLNEMKCLSKLVTFSKLFLNFF